MRRIDHIVVAVRQLDEAADLYRRLGFQVGARNQHPWGTENRLIQFGSSFIELITVGSAPHRIPPHQPGRFSFGAFVRDFLEQREGIAMLALSSADARSDAARFAKQGIGDFAPFSFERKARRPDGAETQVAFTLAFAKDAAAPDAGFFVCQQHFPENFWNANFQQHANLATDIAAVTLSAASPERHAPFLGHFCGAEEQPLPGGGFQFALTGGRVEVSAAQQSSAAPLFTSCTVHVNHLDAVARLLTQEKIPFAASSLAIVVASGICFGSELRFEGPQSSARP